MLDLLYVEQPRKRDRVLGIDKTKTELEESELDCVIVRLVADFAVESVKSV